jgi:hypothetical protein
VVLPGGGRVRGEELGGGAAGGEGEGQRGRERGPGVEDGEGEAEHRQGREVALQFLAVAQGGEVGGVGLGVRGADECHDRALRVSTPHVVVTEHRLGYR